MRRSAWSVALCCLLACSTISDKEQERADTHMQLAQLKLRKGELHYAVREYRNSLEIQERNAEAHFGLGETLRRLGELEEAEKHFERAIKIDPEHQDARLNLGVVHLEQGRWQDAIRENTKLIKDSSFLNPARAYTNRAWAYYKLGDLDKAEADLRSALSRDSSTMQAHLNLGIVLFDRGKLVESMQSFQRVVSLLERVQNPAFACAEAEARFRLAQAYVKLSDRENALKHLQQAGAVKIPCSWRDQAHDYLSVLQ